MQANSIATAVLFSCLLLAASVWDIRKRTIPDILCIGIAAIGLFTFLPVKLLGILPALLLLGAALLLGGGTGMGGGDIKLTAASGFAIGLPTVSAGLIIGMTVAVLCYLVRIIICKRKTSKGQAVNQIALPLVPILSIGFIAATIIEIIGGTIL